MDLALVIATLKEKGYNAVAHDVIKNGKIEHGISIYEIHSSPCICVDELLQDNPSMDVTQLATELISQYEAQKTMVVPTIPMYLVTSKEYTLSSSIKDWANKKKSNRLILLSTESQEMLFLPVDDEELEVAHLSKPISQTNITHMQPKEDFKHKAYLLHMGA